MTMTPRDGDGAEGAVDLWAMAAELERQFAGYKQRFPERTSTCDDILDDDNDAGAALQALDGSGGMSSGEEDGGEGAAGDGVRGRMYEAYTRRRDERLRTVWRARMERKEAEVMALWAQLRGGGPAALAAEEEDDDDGCIAGQEAEDGGEKRRSSDVAAPGWVSGKKHARTRRSFSSVNLVESSRPDVRLRRAQSQEPLPPAGAVAEGASKKHSAPTGAAAPKRKALSGSKGESVKATGSVRQAGSKPPRGGLHRRCSSGGTDVFALPTCSSEQAAASNREDDAQNASSPIRPVVGSDNGGTGIETARAASPESECGSEVVDDGAAADGGEAEGKSAVVDVAEKRDAEETVGQSPEAEAEAKLGNGEITSDSEIEPSYVIIKKKIVEGDAVRGSDADALGSGSDADPHLEDKNVGNPDQATTAADAEITRTANAEEISDEFSSFTGTGRSDRGSARNSSPSCSSRAHSIERLIEADVALVRKKREEQGAGVRRSAQAVSTPPSALSRSASGAARTTSSRGTGLGFKKRFLSFGKKTRGKDGATDIDCTSPASVPVSPADCGSTRRRCRTADDSIRPRVVGSSSDAAASDDTDQSYAASSRACSLQSLVAASPAHSELSEIVPQEKSPKSHRSFFSFRSFNCGRG